MRCAGMLIAVLTVTAVTVFCEDVQAKRERVTTEQFRRDGVIGRLGQPLGTCFRIRAMIIDDDSNAKGRDDVRLLKVSEVEGKRLEVPVKIDFAVHQFATKRVKLTNKNLNLIVYATGVFSGIPKDMPRDVSPWQDKSYSFAESLVVMDQLE